LGGASAAYRRQAKNPYTQVMQELTADIRNNGVEPIYMVYATIAVRYLLTSGEIRWDPHTNRSP
jgi:hypothetical protein